MELISISAAVGGLDHRAENICQDVVRTSQNVPDGGIHVITAADGCSAARLALNGAESSTRIMMRALEHSDAWSDANNSPKALRDYIFLRNQDYFTAIRAREPDLSVFSATCAAAAVRHDGEYILASVGDCTIIAVDTALQPSVALWPARIGSTTFFTSMSADLDNSRRELLRRSIQVMRGNLLREGLLGFAVVTDGADYFMSVQPEGFQSFQRIANAVCTQPDSAEQLLQDELERIAWQSKYGLQHRDDAAAAFLLDKSRFHGTVSIQQPAAPPQTFEAMLEKHPVAQEPAVCWGPLLTLLSQGPLSAEDLVYEHHACELGHLIETLAEPYAADVISYDGERFHYPAE